MRSLTLIYLEKVRYIDDPHTLKFPQIQEVFIPGDYIFSLPIQRTLQHTIVVRIAADSYVTCRGDNGCYGTPSIHYAACILRA
jgi:hypothetical protein